MSQNSSALTFCRNKPSCFIWLVSKATYVHSHLPTLTLHKLSQPFTSRSLPELGNARKTVSTTVPRYSLMKYPIPSTWHLRASHRMTSCGIRKRTNARQDAIDGSPYNLHWIFPTAGDHFYVCGGLSRLPRHVRLGGVSE
jgi:hypothetical protein